jgi:glycosyl transferase, family 25
MNCTTIPGGIGMPATGAPSSYYINLDRDIARRAMIETELERARFKPTRISGVLGRALPDWLGDYYSHRLADAEVGCSASHLVICRTILDARLPYAVIFEDDAELDARSREIIEAAIARAPAGWDVIRLIESSSQPMKPIAKLGHGRSLVRYLRVPRSTTGLIVSASGARKLLTPRVIKEPIDVEIRWPWQLDLNVYGIEPPIVTQRSGVSIESTIPIRSRPRKLNQLQRLRFNLRKLGLVGYIRCRVSGAKISPGIA